MKKLFTADIHLSLYQSDKLKNGISQRLSDIFNSLNQMVKYARDNEIKEIVIGGDLFNDKNLVYTKPYTMFIDFLEENRDITFRIISGNHDMDSSSDDQVSLVKTVRGSNVIGIVKSAQFQNVTYIPYTKNIAEEIKIAEANDILISHFGLNEAQLSSGISIVSDVSLKDLTKFKLVLLGHYHKAQQIKTHKTNVYYVGTPFEKDWNEKHQIKRFLVYDTETLQVESVPLVGYTKHVELLIENKEDRQEILKQYKELKEEGNHVRIKNKTDENIEDDDIYVINEIERDITNRGLNLSMTTEQKLKKYIEIKSNEIPKSEIEKYLARGKSLCEGKTNKEI